LAISSLVDILEQIIARITDDSDIVWTNFNSPGEMRKLLTDLINLLKENDTTCLLRLKILFAPTGSFQEHSIDNGWADKYIYLSNSSDDSFDLLIGDSPFQAV
jgi:hypothetical protein